jgi:hypothetical protein
MSEFLSQYQQGQQAERQALMDLVDELMRDKQVRQSPTAQEALGVIHRELIERYQYEPIREVVEAMSKESNE